MRVLILILVCVLCAMVVADPNDLLWFSGDPNIFTLSGPALTFTWGPEPYIVDPNNLPLNLLCDGSNLEMKADGNLYLSGSFEPFLRHLYEKYVLDGKKFQGRIILEE